MTKKECFEALNFITNLLSSKQVPLNVYKKQLDILIQLIYKQFNNPPFDFKDIPNDHIWDNKEKQYLDVLDVRCDLDKGLIIEYITNDIENPKILYVEYEDNRFYKKRVE